MRSDQANQDPARALHGDRAGGGGGRWRSHYMKLPAMLFGVGHYTVTVELPQAGGPVRERQRHLPRHRGRPGRTRAADPNRGGGGAVAEVRDRHPVGSATPRCTASRRSASSTSRCCRAAATRRRCETATSSRWTGHVGAARHQRAARRDANRGLQAIPQRQPQDRHRRGLHRCRRAGPRAVPDRQGLHRIWPSTRARISTR